MPVYAAPVRETKFVLDHIVELGKYDNLPAFANASSDIVGAILEEGGCFSSEVLAPLNRIGDEEGCTRHADGSVTTPAGFKDAYKQFCELGFTGGSLDALVAGAMLSLAKRKALSEACIRATARSSAAAASSGRLGKLSVSSAIACTSP